MPYTELGIRFLIGTVFLIAAVSKVASGRSFAAFTTSLGRLNVIPGAVTRAVAIAVVSAESLVCLLVAVPQPRVAGLGLVLAAALLLGFTIAIGRVLARDIRATCRCFGGGSSAPLGVRHIVRNLLLAGLALFAAGTALLRDSGPAQPAGLAVAAAAGLLAGGCVATLDAIAALFRPMNATDAAPGTRTERRAAAVVPPSFR